jgi:hypothetical protein
MTLCSYTVFLDWCCQVRFGNDSQKPKTGAIREARIYGAGEGIARFGAKGALSVQRLQGDVWYEVKGSVTTAIIRPLDDKLNEHKR